MALESPGHHELARLLYLSELAAAAVDAPTGKGHHHAPLTGDAQVRGPVRHEVEVGVSPPALDLVGGERAKDTGWRSGDLHGRNDHASAAVGHGAWCVPFRGGRQSEISLCLWFGCHLSSST